VNLGFLFFYFTIQVAFEYCITVRHLQPEKKEISIRGKKKVRRKKDVNETVNLTYYC